MVAKKPRIVIIGAGVAGLTAAHKLYTTAGDLVDVSIFEAGDRIGGRILTSEFAGDRVEMGATWIHGIGSSPIYALAQQIGALTTTDPYERMDGFPEDPVTVVEGGGILTPSFVEPISSLYTNLMDAARHGRVTVGPNKPTGGLGSYLRKALKEHRGKLTAAGGGGEWTLDAVFAMNENTERTFTSADDLDDLNLAAESEYRECPGDQITIAKGYSRIIETLAGALPKDSILLNAKVRRIDWCAGGVSPVRVHVDGGAVVAADHVIVTVSLGVLKAGLKKEADPGFALEFSPALPAFKNEAIGRLGFGVVNKLFMEIDGEAAPFPFLQLAFDVTEGEENGHVARIPRWMRKTASICPIYGGSHVLLAWLAGKEATQMEELNDEEIISGVHATLDGFCGKVDGRCNGSDGRGGNYGRILRVKRSGWGKNPLFRGSYSYVATATSGDDLDLMAEPLPRGALEREGGGVKPLQVLFAGEATHRTHYSTTHGAYFSGVREANRLLHYYRYGNSDSSCQL